MSEPVHHDPRAEARTAWTRAALGDDDAVPVRASMDAGFRSYWRAQCAAGSRIVMDSPPDKEDVRPWLQVRDLLEAGGVRVPRVLAQDVDTGFLLLEDLGADTYLHVINGDNADTLFDDAVAQLLKIQAIEPPADLPAFDEELLARELRLFDEWFCGHHLGMALDCGDMETLDGAYRVLVDAALAQPQVLVHRDFMPRNLMPSADGPAVLDFQDLVSGPIAYDPASLFKDAFLSWPLEKVDAWLARYHAKALAAGLPVRPWPQFLRDADWMGVQRHLKILGIFVRLRDRDGKGHYFQDAPRFIRYLDEVLPRYPELAPLQELFERRFKPAMAAKAAA